MNNDLLANCLLVNNDVQVKKNKKYKYVSIAHTNRRKIKENNVL